MNPSTPGHEAAREVEEPLPLTLRFVLVLGGLIVIGWFLMFVLLWERW